MPGRATEEDYKVSHDKIKAAARKRMMQTGESYAVAREAVIESRQQARRGRQSPAAMRLSAAFLNVAKLNASVLADYAKLTSAAKLTALAVPSAAKLNASVLADYSKGNSSA
jgi:hypothetical protein